MNYKRHFVILIAAILLYGFYTVVEDSKEKFAKSDSLPKSLTESESLPQTESKTPQQPQSEAKPEEPALQQASENKSKTTRRQQFAAFEEEKRRGLHPGKRIVGLGYKTWKDIEEPDYDMEQEFNTVYSKKRK